ncbi:MAG: imidazole glycerol phosphate synthase subunit HisH [Patescibacteria group bacterium]|jgi:glutamine amidotransferase
MKPVKIAITDYGVGNLYSLVRALKFFNASAEITEDADSLDGFDGIILPGVGSFAAGMRGLKIRGLAEKIKKLAGEGKPILGICLGAQLLLTEGHEFGTFNGLDIIKGKVIKFPPLENKEKIPHIGWNKLSLPKGGSWGKTVLDGIKEESDVYFVHSYYLDPESTGDVLALTDYGGFAFCSAVKKGNVYGCQFHPEKSGKVGLKIIDNFLKICGGQLSV